MCAHNAFHFAFVNRLQQRQCTRVVLVFLDASRHKYIGIQKDLHFFPSFPAADEIRPSRSSAIIFSTLAVVIGSAKSPVNTSTFPLRTSVPPSSVGSSRKLFPSTEMRSLSPGTRLNWSRSGFGSTTRPALSIWIVSVFMTLIIPFGRSKWKRPFGPYCHGPGITAPNHQDEPLFLARNPFASAPNPPAIK